MIGSHVRALYKSAKPGSCFCGRPVAKKTGGRRRRMCGRAACLKKYQRAYWADNPRPTSLRRIAKVTKDKFWARVKLSCGHEVLIPRGTLESSVRKHCPMCRMRARP